MPYPQDRTRPTSAAKDQTEPAARLSHLRHHPPPHRLFLYTDSAGHHTMTIDIWTSGDSP